MFRSVGVRVWVQPTAAPPAGLPAVLFVDSKRVAIDLWNMQITVLWPQIPAGSRHFCRRRPSLFQREELVKLFKRLDTQFAFLGIVRKAWDVGLTVLHAYMTIIYWYIWLYMDLYNHVYFFAVKCDSDRFFLCWYFSCYNIMYITL